MDGRLRILETIYRFDVNERDHIQLIQEAAAKHWQKRSPIMLLSGRLRANGGVDITLPDVTRSDGKDYAALLRNVPMNEVDHSLRVSVIPRYGSARDLGTNGVLNNRITMQILESAGIADLVGCHAATGDGGGASLMAILRTTPRVSEGERNHWQPLAEHLAAGWRVRQRLEHGMALQDLADAMFRPSGNCVEFMDSRVSGGTRERLQDLVRNREQERTPHTTWDRLWPELIDGRWTLIDHYEADGRRVVLALRNTPMAASLSRLSRDEIVVLSYIRRGASNKEVSLNMSVSSATVTRLLRSVATKLNAALADIIQFSPADTIHAHDLLFGTTRLTVLSQDTTAQWATRLTDAERGVVAEVLRGRTNREIAAARGRSVRTIVNQLASAFEKMNVRSRRELISRATGHTADV